MGLYIELPENWARFSLEVTDVHGHELEAKVIDTDFDLVRCKECGHSKEWYGDRRLCYLWAEAGVSVFEGGYCNYGERRTEQSQINTIDKQSEEAIKEIVKDYIKVTYGSIDNL